MSSINTKLQYHKAVTVSHLARAVAKKIVLCARMRKIGHKKLASQLGISALTSRLLLSGNYIPPPELQERIRRWMIDGFDYSNSPMMKAKRQAEVHNQRGWARIYIYLPSDAEKRLRNMAHDLGMSRSSFLHVLIEYMHKNRPEMLKLCDAMAQTEQILVAHLLNENDPLVPILQCDLKWQHSATQGKTIDATERKMTVLEEINEIQLHDGPASGCVTLEELENLEEV